MNVYMGEINDGNRLGQGEIQEKISDLSSDVIDKIKEVSTQVENVKCDLDDKQRQVIMRVFCNPNSTLKEKFLRLLNP